MMISHLAKSSDSMLPNELLKPVLTCLVNGTMEKNSMVKSCRFVSLYLNKSKKTKQSTLFHSSETALVDVLHMRKGPQGQQQVLCLFPIPRYPLYLLYQGLAAMDTGARDSLADVISRSLTKLATQPEGKVTF